MTPTHAGSLQITQESLAFLRSAIDDLPQAALEWRPLPTANSLSVLVAHSISATRFFLRAGSGYVGSITEYRGGERAAAFTTAGVSKDDLLDLIDRFVDEAKAILGEGTEEHIAGDVEMPTTDNLPVPTRNGAGTLMAAVGHLREHVGHVQLMHDLWLAENPA